MFAELIVIASCARQADPSGLYLSQVHSSFSNNGSPSACHEQLCSCKCEFVFSGLSLLRHSYDCHSIELQPLMNLFRLLDCLDDCCLVLSHNSNVLVPLQCVGPARPLLIILPHICITGILRLTHWNCGNLMLHHHGNTGNLIKVLDL